jgi:hypothetical protein
MKNFFNTRDPKGAPEKQLTMLEFVNLAKENGYTEDFIVRGKLLYPMYKNRSYLAEDVNIVNFLRFEGATDPGDSSIVYLVETEDGRKGTLTDAFGVYADENIGKFVKEVEAHQTIKTEEQGNVK